MTRAIDEKAVGLFWPAACVLVVAFAGFSCDVAAQQATLGAPFGATANPFRSGAPGRRVTYVCAATSANDAPVWGSSPYQDDSAVCVAAIHAGVLKENQEGVVTFVTGPDAGTYSGSTQHGVTSEKWGGGGGTRSFTFDTTGQPGVIDWITTGQAIPVDYKQPIVVVCPPVASVPDGNGTYGTDVYDDSSHICVAAVHVNAISVAGGPVQVTMAGPQSAFTGSARFGVTTQDWGGGGSTSFRVAAASSSGSGPSGAAASVTGIVVTVDAKGVPTVRWSAVPGATGYVVARWFVGDAACCNNFSPPGAPLTTPTWLDGGTLPKLGTYGYRVYATTSSGTLSGEITFAWKGTTSGGQPTLSARDPTPPASTAPVLATALPQTAAPVAFTPVEPRYRVLLLGATVRVGTKESTGSDGQGDEIYAAAVALQWDRSKGLETSRSVVRTVEYGDVGATAASADRIRAGTAQAGTGGLKGGDVAPEGFAAPAKNSPTKGSPSSTQFPLLVWEGPLTAGVDGVLIVPSLWERDTADTAYRRYEALWKLFPLVDVLKSPPVQVQIKSPVPMVAVTVGSVLVPPTLISLTDLGLGIVDRPLGLTPAPLIEPYDDRVILVTRESLNALTAVGNSIDLPIRYSEPNADPILGGDYTLYLRVERTQ